MENETPIERVDYLSESQAKAILAEVIATLILNGTGMAVSDVLAMHGLLTNDECRSVFLASRK